MKKILLPLVALFFVVACQKGPADMKLKTDDDKTFYTMGVMLGGNLQKLSLTDPELNALVKGLMDAAKDKKPEIDVQQFQPKIQAVVMGRMQKASEDAKNEGMKYYENFLKEEGVQKTESGLAYKILTEGKGIKPAAEDTVEVHYHGTLTDGSVFDSSIERGKTTSFPLNRVIKGWTEGLQLIGEGGKIRLVIPAELAYGDRGAGKIPGGATLTFDVELFKVTKAEAPKPVAKPAKVNAKAKKK